MTKNKNTGSFGNTADGDYESDTDASLKDVMAALKVLEAKHAVALASLYDDVERLLYRYQLFVLQGVRETIAKHAGVSWYLVDKGDGRALISYQDGPHGEWFNECYADELPLWLLIGLVRRIARRKPLGDQDADDTIAALDAADAEYFRTQTERDAKRNIMQLSTLRRRNP